MTKNLELLLPVGNYQMCLAAIHNGADAVYMGVPGFNARGRSLDFSFEELKEMIELCHLYGVKVHLAFNVLIFQSELQKAHEHLKKIISLSPDAFIIQDLGLAQMIKAIAPWQVIHGSTQMSISDHGAIELLDDLDIKRFVLARENSLKEIQIIRENTTKELEVFVHGALCVAYSGQCFTSESIGGRSANRGQCAQSCRLGYELFIDGEKRSMNGRDYLVSPQDLCGLDHVKDLKEIGVDSLKVEGRLKGEDYVAQCGQSYSQAIKGKDGLVSDKKNLSLTYSRGFFSGWLNGVDHQQLVNGHYSSHRGIYLGKGELKKNRLVLLQKYDLHAGQGLLMVTSLGEEKGSKVFKKVNETTVVLREKFSEQLVEVYLNSDEGLKKTLTASFNQKDLLKKIPISISVIVENNALKVTYDDEVHQVSGGIDNLELAKEKKTASSLVKSELLKLGGSVYFCQKYHSEDLDDYFIPHKLIKDLRKKLLGQLNDERVNYKPQVLKSYKVPLKDNQTQACEGKLNVLLRSLGQVKDFIEASFSSINRVCLDFEFGKEYFLAVELLRKHHFHVEVATTRIHKPNEFYNLNQILRLKPDSILVRNLGALNFLKEKEIPLYGDFSLNCANSLSFNYLLDKGLSGVNLSYDLNENELREMIKSIDATKAEVTIHQYMPEFHMEHCVFAAFLSDGSSFKDCGKPCERHYVELKDPYGKMHFLKADKECRNTLFRGQAQSAAYLCDRLKKSGVGQFRLELMDERGEVLISKVREMLDLVSGKKSYQEIQKNMLSYETYGLSSGPLSLTKQYQDRKKTRV